MSTSAATMVLAVPLLWSGCSPPAPDTSAAAPEALATDAQLSKAEVIHIATDRAELQGIDLAQFYEPDVEYRVAGQSRTWWLFFKGRDPSGVGNHFLIQVDDRTREAQFHGGK